MAKIIKVLANNQQFTDHTFYTFGAFVYQNDLLFENLTPRCIKSTI